MEGMRKGAKRKGKSRRTSEALPQAVYHADGLSDHEWVDGVPGSDEHFLDGLSGSGGNLDKETDELPVTPWAGDSGEVIDIGDDEDEATTPKATHADTRMVVFSLEIVDGENDAELCGSHTVPLQGFDEQLPTLLDCMHSLLLPYENATHVTWGSRPLSLLVAAMARVGCLLPEPITHSVDRPTR
ncbi:hypothetical protein T492DRAFT_872403 [Pavlovales sp. CCMP2436]|nr:hypothetical protein T492DRAFT_872403 [Pavlovales sp. CCMP2436]